MAKTTYAPRTWVDDLVGGFDAGAKIDKKIDETAERRKKAKTSGVIASEMTNKLYTVEDKGWLGNIMYDKFGLGDPPKVTEQAGPPAPRPANAAAAAPATEAPPSDARTMAATGTAALQGALAGSATSPAPEMVQPEEIAVSPIQIAAPAAATPMVPMPAPVADATPRGSDVQQLLLAKKINPRASWLPEARV